MSEKVQKIIFYIIIICYAIGYIALGLFPALHDFHSEYLVLGIIIFISFLMNNSIIVTKSRRLKFFMILMILFLSFTIVIEFFNVDSLVLFNKIAHGVLHVLFAGTYLYTLSLIFSRAQKLYKDSIINEQVFDLSNLVIFEYYYETKTMITRISAKMQSIHNLDPIYNCELEDVRNKSLSLYELISHTKEDKNPENYIDKIIVNTKNLTLKTRGIEFYPKHLVIVASDYSTIIELEKEIDEGHHLHSELLKNLPVVVIEIKLIFNNKNQAIDYEYLYANEAFSKIIIPNTKEYIGKRASKVIPKYYKKFVKEYAKAYHTNETIEFTLPVYEDDKLHYFIVYKTKGDNVVVIIQPIHEIIQADARLEYISTHNIYNDLLNYDGLLKEINALEVQDRVDVFHIMIKDYNDIKNYYGQEYAKDIIKKIGTMIDDNINFNKLIANYENNKFILVILNPTNYEMKYVEEFLSKTLYQKHIVKNIKINTKLDIGHANVRDNVTPKEIIDLIAKATIASIEARNESKNYIVQYDEQLSEELDRRIIIARKILEAIENNSIDIHFQKVINTRDNSIVFFEALSRWTDSELGYINPEVMIKTAGESSLSEYLNYYLVDKSLYEYKVLTKDKYEDVKLSINLAPYFFEYEDSFDFLIERVEYYEIPKNNVCLEISENTFIDNIEDIAEKIKYLRSLGFLIAIDDFGSKYSSLGILELIQFDILKLDGIFVKNKESDIYRSILTNFIKTIKSKKKIVVIEKIETKEESQIFIDYECMVQQGYYFHKPEKNVDILKEKW